MIPSLNSASVSHGKAASDFAVSTVEKVARSRMQPSEFISVSLHPDNGMPDSTHLVQTVPGRKLSECLEPYLLMHHLSPDCVEFFLEGSSTAIPPLSDCRYLAGSKIFVRLRREMFSRGRNSHVPLPVDTLVDQMPFIADRKVPVSIFRGFDADRPSCDKPRKCSVDTISRKSSFGTRKVLGKPRSLSTCPVNALFAEEIGGPSLSTVSTPTHSGNPYLGELVAVYPPRRGSGSVDSSSNSNSMIASAGGQSCDGDSGSFMFAEDFSGTISGKSRTQRKGIFSMRDNKESKLTAVADKILAQAMTTTSTEVLDIEEHWTAIVQKHMTLSETMQKQQNALWEMVETEKRYIQALQNMHTLTLVFLELQRQGFCLDVDFRKVFLNYKELFSCNLSFWQKGMLPMLEAARETGAPLNPCLMAAGFVDITSWSVCYIDFNVAHGESLTYVRKRQKESEKFAEFVTWCEGLNFMNRQTLIDNLSIPMQRLTRYPLMLKNVLKASTDPEEKLALQDMIDRSEAATGRLNNEMNNNDLRIQLLAIMNTIECYDVIDQEECDRIHQLRPDFRHLNLLQPMPFIRGPPRFRQMITKGDLKMKEFKQGPKVEVHCILFTDMFLICKATSKRADRYRIIKAPIHISSIICVPQESAVFTLIAMNEFGSASMCFSMYSTSFEEARRWKEMIQIAQEDFARLRIPDMGQFFAEREQHFTNFREQLRCYTPTGPLSADAKAAIAHRKSHSMDSQVVAASRPSSSHLRKSDAIASAEQLDRRFGSDGTPGSSGSKASLSSIPDELPRSNSLACRHNSPARATSGISAVPLSATNSFSDNINTTAPLPAPDIASIEEQSTDAFECAGHAADEVLCSNIDFNTSGDSLTSQNLRQLAMNNANGRRFEKRYHTASEIESLRPSTQAGPTAILKRFSFNVSSAVSGSSRKISSKLNERNGRRHSQSTVASSDSFGSSTSGISSASASSQDTGTMISSPLTDAGTLVNLAAEVQGNAHHVSTVLIGGDVSPSLVDFDPGSHVPPLPEAPPPLSDDIADLPKDKTELLKFILDDSVETSDI